MSRNRSGSRKKSRLIRVAFWVLAVPAFAWLSVVELINLSTKQYVFDQVGQIKHAPEAIVFGAGLTRSGSPTIVLSRRLDGAIALYRQHKVDRLLMSGDNRTVDHNEPQAMRKYAVKLGVKPDDIDLDYGGRDTYDTCYRAKRLFGIDKAIMVTQQYHAPRAVYVGRSLGIDSVAYGVPNLDEIPSLQLSYNCRELAADVKAVWDTSVSHRKPYVALNGKRGHPL